MNNYSMINSTTSSNSNIITTSNQFTKNNLINARKKSLTTNENGIMTQKQQNHHPNPPTKPPPTLPKPKFILPQTSATNLVLQRNLKSKSELNIATTAPNTTTMPSCSSSCSNDSSSSSCCSSGKPVKPCAPENTKTNNNTIMIPLRNKLLENSSLVSSSQGYHSDTWESSHSSRQSFDLDSQAPNSTSSFFGFPEKAIEY